MTIAVASGKGGTGKTTIAANLAVSSPDSIKLLDCDVEEPNCHIFLNPLIKSRIETGILVPHADPERCNSCGECGRVCQYNAIVSLKTQPLVFPELCHGCGGCALICPTGAITEVERNIGVVEDGIRGDLLFAHGILNVGEAMAPPLIRAVRRNGTAKSHVIIDAPPGTSCPVVTAIGGADYVVLVTEPTPFGLNDLYLAVEMVRALDIPFGVVINRSDIGDDKVKEFCREQGIEILLELPHDRRIAEAYSRGELAVEHIEEMKPVFQKLYKRITVKGN